MSNRSWVRGPRALAALATMGLLIAVVAAPAHARTSAPAGRDGDRYVFTDLGVLGGLDSVAWSVSKSGIVVGHADTSPGSGSSGFHAYRWVPVRPHATVGTITDLGAIPPGGSSAATGVNAFGVVVGESLSPAGVAKAFVYDRRTRALPGLGGGSSGASDINDHGLVVGYAKTRASADHAVLWTLPRGASARIGRPIDLGVPRGWIGSSASAVNARGQVAGGVLDADYYGVAAVWTPFRADRSRGRWTVLGLLPGGTGTVARDINRRGVVVGQGDSSLGDRGFVFDGRLHVLAPLPGGTWSFAEGINDCGDVVGYSDTGDGTGDYAVLFRAGRAIDLNRWLPATARSAGYVLRSAYDINNHGQIVGVASIGGHAHAFLLTPRA